jgi:uncharacterized protein (TIGR03083 family)
MVNALSAISVDQTKVGHACQTVAGRVADMIRPLPDTQLPIPGAEWTVGEAAAHLADTKRLAADIAGGATIPYGDGTRTREMFATVNTQRLAEFQERQGAVLADQIVAATNDLVQNAARQPSAYQVQAPMGMMDIGTFLSYMLTHLLQHGCAIARALGQDLPVEPGHLELTLPFMTMAMTVVADKAAIGELDACVELRFRGGPRLAVTFDKGVPTISPSPPRRVDCYVSADPVAFFLVAMGLSRPWGAIARGKIVSWGRRPWLAITLPTFFPAR